MCKKSKAAAKLQASFRARQSFAKTTKTEKGITNPLPKAHLSSMIFMPLQGVPMVTSATWAATCASPRPAKTTLTVPGRWYNCVVQGGLWR